jgi:hypothetical protein
MVRRSIRLGWLAGLLVINAAGSASAQDVRVHVVVGKDVAQDVRDVIRDAIRIVHQTIGPNLGRDIAEAIREATGAPGPFEHPIVPGAAQNRDFRITQEARETKTLKLGATGSLELRNISGAITVTAGSGTDAVIEIVRVSRGRTDADAKAGLERVTVDVTQVGDRATVRTRYPDDRRPPYSVEVAYHVKAPAGTRLTIASIGGDITVSDIHGDTSASTTGGNTTISNGRVSSAKSVGGNVRLTGTETDGTLDVETMGGQIVLKQIKARRVQAGNIGGSIIVQDATCEVADLGSTGGDVEFAGPLARNGRYELHSTGGAVRFFPIGSVGYEVQASTFAGEIRTEGVTLQMQGQVTGRGPNRSIRGTVGDGSALVILRTLSGSVLIGRK